MVADVPQHGVQLGAPHRPPISARLTRYTWRRWKRWSGCMSSSAQYCVHDLRTEQSRPRCTEAEFPQ